MGVVNGSYKYASTVAEWTVTEAAVYEFDCNDMLRNVGGALILLTVARTRWTLICDNARLPGIYPSSYRILILLCKSLKSTPELVAQGLETGT